jgi:hypothetical protein
VIQRKTDSFWANAIGSATANRAGHTEPREPDPAASERTERLTARQARTLLVISAVLFVGACLTVFLPYFVVEKRPDVFTGEGGATYSYTGTELITGSYKRPPSPPGVYDVQEDAANHADKGRGNPFLVMSLAFVGLVTLRLRRHGLVALILAVASIIVLMAGCSSVFELELLGPGPLDDHLAIGFWLGVLFVAVAIPLRFVLWRLAPEQSREGKPTNQTTPPEAAPG